MHGKIMRPVITRRMVMKKIMRPVITGRMIFFNHASVITGRMIFF